MMTDNAEIRRNKVIGWIALLGFLLAAQKGKQ
jgi:hypothetical protein